MSYAATVLRHKLRELATWPAGEPVPSPCISVCRVDSATGQCEGCFRTLEEIAAWRGLGEREKLDIWTRLGERAK